MGYEGFGCGVVAEGGAGRLDVGREFGLVEGFLRGRIVLFGDYVVDGLFHLWLFFIYTSKMQLLTTHSPGNHRTSPKFYVVNQASSNN